ncbi:IS4 family transposase [Fundicoccus culcitae]|uniref:IS4 family transposase n=1 Tax=Fundicoccus culcitae TaxID=2969821 RepID=A0ABY5P687_9LACT|nr:IS4 family transposase [Fundicoccus culcitae]UUX33913.1 IS4 family transposase [Fundicoccus culcitae]
MSRFAKITFNHLKEAIQSVCQNRADHVYQPDVDFTRNRKLTMPVVIESVIKFGAESLNNELFRLWNNHTETPTPSAFVQARSKLKVSAFKEVFHRFNQTLDNIKTFKGYRLLAHDGSDLPLPQNVTDHDNHYKDEKATGYNMVHLNFLYDLLNKQFLDVDIQKSRQSDERASLIQMAKTIKTNIPSIFIADRGYPSYNVFAHLQELQHKYVIRCKDLNDRDFVRKSDVPDTDEYDTIVSLKIARSRIKAYTEDPSFRFLAYTSKFDFLERGSKNYYELTLRVVRFKLSENTYQCLITNLDESFTSNDLKELYHLRWGIETALCVSAQ